MASVAPPSGVTLDTGYITGSMIGHVDLPEVAGTTPTDQGQAALLTFLRQLATNAPANPGEDINGKVGFTDAAGQQHIFRWQLATTPSGTDNY
jgi:hypothetical protein